MRPFAFACLLPLAIFVAGASAHEVRPAYLQLHQANAETYDVFWKVPGQGDLRLGINVQLPEGCTTVSEPRRTLANNVYTEHWTFKRPGGLNGSSVGVTGLSATMTDVLARVERLDGTTQVARLSASSPSFVVEASPNGFQVAETYLRLGIEHILTGIDHLLYILAMLCLVCGWKRVVATMTAFTATHSLTLTGATLGWVHVPQPPVEACIALSIVFVTREIVCSRNGQSGLTERWPWVISLTFGLLHGFGFAGALSEVGLPQKAIPVALLFFNGGVEIGQLLFVTTVVVFMAFGRHAIQQLNLSTVSFLRSPLIRFGPAYAMGTVAAFWVIQRVAAF